MKLTAWRRRRRGPDRSLSRGLAMLGAAFVPLLVATHYGFYNTVCGIGILLGNIGTG